MDESRCSQRLYLPSKFDTGFHSAGKPPRRPGKSVLLAVHYVPAGAYCFPCLRAEHSPSFYAIWIEASSVRIVAQKRLALFTWVTCLNVNFAVHSPDSVCMDGVPPMAVHAVVLLPPVGYRKLQEDVLFPTVLI